MLAIRARNKPNNQSKDKFMNAQSLQKETDSLS